MKTLKMVTCTDNSDQEHELTNGKIYKVTEYGSGFIEVVNDLRVIQDYVCETFGIPSNNL